MYRGNVSRSMDGDCKRRGKWSGNADQPKESRCWVLHLKSILRDLPVDFKKRIRVNTNKKTEGLLICTPFTGHPVGGVLLCGTRMSTKGNV